MTQDFFGSRGSVTIRPPATANLMIDSADREESLFSTPYQFQITKRDSILNGFFNRIATTEVVLEWKQENITDVGPNSNNFLFMDISGVGGNTFRNANYQQQITPGSYTVAEVLAQIVYELNQDTGTTGGTFTLVPASTNPQGFTKIDASGVLFSMYPANPVLTSLLTLQLNFFEPPDLEAFAFLTAPDIRPVRYIDFVSSDVTYAQNLKDSSTAPIPRDVLCRWYFADDSPEELDSCGFPIYMGYKPFVRRRIFNPPKQIRWDNNLPIGNLRFELYDNEGRGMNFVYPTDTATNWLMTLQVSEN
jgi:hypothetical protein